MIRKFATAAALAAAIVAVPGVASATPGDPGQCTGTGYCQVEPGSSGILDGNSVVVPRPSAWDQFRYIAGYALADFFFGPRW